MSFLVAMVVRVVKALPDVVLSVDVVLVDVVDQVDISVGILQLGVVMEGNGRERVEEVGIDGPGLGHVVVLFLLDGVVLGLGVGLVSAIVKTGGGRVYQGVDTPAHPAKSTHRVCSAHFLFLSK